MQLIKQKTRGVLRNVTPAVIIISITVIGVIYLITSQADDCVVSGPTSSSASEAASDAVSVPVSTETCPASAPVTTPTPPPPPDTTAPSIPTNLRSSLKTTSSITLAWNPSSDAGGSGLKRYNIYRNNVLLTSTSLLSYIDSGLSPNTSYTYKVSAEDNAGNKSNLSAALSVSTSSIASPLPVPIITPTPPSISPPSSAGGSPSGKPADLNGNSTVDIFDLSILLSNYGSITTTGDLNANGTVDIFDLSILLSNYE